MTKTQAEAKAQWLANLYQQVYAIVFESGRYDAEPENSTIPTSTIYGLVTPSRAGT